MTDLTARQVTRNMLQRVISSDDLERINEEHGIQLTIGATLYDALNAVLLKRSAEGDREAAALVEKYGIK